MGGGPHYRRPLHCGVFKSSYPDPGESSPHNEERTAYNDKGTSYNDDKQSTHIV